MSLKDIFEWIINVNLFYVIGAVVAFIAIALIREWVDANEEKVSVIMGWFWIILISYIIFSFLVAYLDA